MKKIRLMAMATASALLLGSLAAVAQDAVKLQPSKNKVLFENDRVRVIEVTNEPGGKLEMHSHPAHVVYFLEPAKAKFTDKDGKVTDFQGKKGEVRWTDPVTHSVENVDSTPMRAVVVELKDAPK